MWGFSARQLLRAPVRTALWVIALGLACGAACLGVGIYSATLQNAAAIEAEYTTIATVQDTQLYDQAMEQGRKAGLQEMEVSALAVRRARASYETLSAALDASPLAERDRRELYAGYIPDAELMADWVNYAYLSYNNTYLNCILHVQKRMYRGQEQTYVERELLRYGEYNDLFKLIRVEYPREAGLELELDQDYIVFGSLQYMGHEQVSQVTIYPAEEGTGYLAFPFNGSLEEYLASAPEVEALIQRYTVAMHSADVLTCDDLNALPPFNSGEKSLLEGRAFTPEEAAAGERVCLVSSSFADYNHITLGDTLTLQLYPCSVTGIRPIFGFWQSGAWARTGMGDQEQMTEPLAYRVVGLYSAPGWECTAENFSPNSVIIPYASADMPASEMRAAGFLSSWAVNNRDLEALTEELAPAELGCDAMVTFHDQGYSDIAPLLDSVRYNARVVLILCLVTWAAVSMLFLVLFLLRSRREAGVLRSLGAGKARTARSLTAGLMLTVLAACLLGGCLSALLFDGAMDRVLNLGYGQVAESLKFSDAPSALARLAPEEAASPWAAVLAVPGILAVLGVLGGGASLLISREKPRNLFRGEE